MTVSTDHTTPGELVLPTLAGGDLPGLAVLEQWVSAAAAAEQLVRRIVDTPFVPASLWPLPPGHTLKTYPRPQIPARDETQEAFHWRREVAIASGTSSVLRGMSLGLDPLVSLDQIFVIYGRPSMYVKLKLALVQARGHEIRLLARDDEHAVAYGKRLGSPDGDDVTIEITIAQARRAGWTKNDAYEKTPADMLANRALSRVMDLIASDVLFGIASVEDVDPEPEPAPAAAKVTVEELVERLDERAGKGAPVAPAAVVEAAPVVDEPPADRTVPHADPAPLDERAWRLVNDAFVRLGVTGPGQKAKRLAIVRHVIGRTVVSATELSAVEGDLLLETLNGMDRPTVAALLADLLVARGPAGEDQGPAAPESAPAPAPGPQGAEGWPADVDPSDADLEPTDDELAQYGETR